VDIVALAGGSHTALSLDATRVVDDGFASISVTDAFPKVDQPKISGIEIKALELHFAHAVTQGPYAAVDIENSGSAVVHVDGTPSHTHAPGLVLNSWVWKQGPNILATTEVADLTFSVGNHTVSLTVTDTNGNVHTESTTITVLPFGHPAVTGLSPESGSIAGNEEITITGSGFTYSAEETVVTFGLLELTGAAIEIVDPNTIKVLNPPVVVARPVSVLVSTPLGMSLPKTFTYIGSVPIEFIASKLTDFAAPARGEFGPDGRLYVATTDGKLAKLTLNDDFTQVLSTVVSDATPGRAILGITFDPMDTGPNPPVYCSSSNIWHADKTSTSGEAINGKIVKVSGANLDIVEDIITGLPVADSDHGELLSHLITVFVFRQRVSLIFFFSLVQPSMTWSLETTESCIFKWPPVQTVVLSLGCYKRTLTILGAH